MKKLLLVALILLAGFSCFAQTNFLSNIELKFDQTMSGREYTVEAGGLYGVQTKQMGGFIDLYTPIGATNSAFGIGTSIAYLGSFYNANINGKIGVEIPRTSLYAYVESGGGLDLKTSTLINQDFAGLIYKRQFNQRIFTTGLAIGKISNYNGWILAFGTSFTF